MATADIHTLVSLVSARFRSPPACFMWRPAHLTVVSACVGATPEWRALCGVASENHAEYAAAHDYGLLFDGCAPLHARSPHWTKIPLLLATLVNMPKFLETELVTRNITNQGTILETFNKG